MRAYLTRRYWFSASHRLNNEALGHEENQRIYGKCNNPHGHGHNYALEVTLGGAVDAQTGMVCDIGQLDRFVDAEIIERFGHEHLNALSQFAKTVPTTENLCAEIYRIIGSGFHSAKLAKIRLEETNSNSFEYAGGAEVPF